MYLTTTKSSILNKSQDFRKSTFKNYFESTFQIGQNKIGLLTIQSGFFHPEKRQYDKLGINASNNPLWQHILLVNFYWFWNESIFNFYDIKQSNFEEITNEIWPFMAVNWKIGTKNISIFDYDLGICYNRDRYKRVWLNLVLYRLVKSTFNFNF